MTTPNIPKGPIPTNEQPPFEPAYPEGSGAPLPPELEPQMPVAPGQVAVPEGHVAVNPQVANQLPPTPEQ